MTAASPPDGEKLKGCPWQNWFAWHPVRIDGRWRWLARVERLFVAAGFCDFAVYYRLRKGAPK